MRILFLSNEFPHTYRPTKATFNYDLLTALGAIHEVTVVSPIPWLEELITRGRQPFRAWPRQRKVGRLAVWHPRFYYTPGCLRQWYGPFLWWSLRRTVSRLARGPRPECILSYWAHPDGEAAVRLARKWGIPCMVIVGGSDVLLLGRERRRGACIRSVLQRAEGVIALSRDLGQHVRAMGVPAERVHVLRRGVDPSLFSPGDRVAARRDLGLSPGVPMILWVGRFAPVKGLDVLVAACERLRKDRPDFRLCLIGDGPLRGELLSEVSRRGLGGQIRFVGTLPHEQLAPWFRAADVTVLPSRSEGIPNVLLESLACGTPFVASNVGGIGEIADYPVARLVAPERPAELAAALQDSLANPATVGTSDSPPTLAQFARNVAELAHDLAKAPNQVVSGKG